MSRLCGGASCSVPLTYQTCTLHPHAHNPCSTTNECRQNSPSITIPLPVNFPTLQPSHPFTAPYPNLSRLISLSCMPLLVFPAYLAPLCHPCPHLSPLSLLALYQFHLGHDAFVCNIVRALEEVGERPMSTASRGCSNTRSLHGSARRTTSFPLQPCPCAQPLCRRCGVAPPGWRCAAQAAQRAAVTRGVSRNANLQFQDAQESHRRQQQLQPLGARAQAEAAAAMRAPARGGRGGGFGGRAGGARGAGEQHAVWRMRAGRLASRPAVCGATPMRQPCLWAQQRAACRAIAPSSPAGGGFAGRGGGRGGFGGRGGGRGGFGGRGGYNEGPPDRECCLPPRAVAAGCRLRPPPALARASLCPLPA